MSDAHGYEMQLKEKDARIEAWKLRVEQLEAEVERLTNQISELEDEADELEFEANQFDGIVDLQRSKINWLQTELATARAAAVQ